MDMFTIINDNSCKGIKYKFSSPYAPAHYVVELLNEYSFIITLYSIKRRRRNKTKKKKERKNVIKAKVENDVDITSNLN